MRPLKGFAMSDRFVQRSRREPAHNTYIWMELWGWAALDGIDLKKEMVYIDGWPHHLQSIRMEANPYKGKPRLMALHFKGVAYDKIKAIGLQPHDKGDRNIRSTLHRREQDYYRNNSDAVDEWWEQRAGEDPR